MTYIEMEITKNTRLVWEFSASQTDIFIYETDIVIGNERLYIIRSVNITSNEEYIRFGNSTQALSLAKTYNRWVVWDERKKFIVEI